MEASSYGDCPDGCRNSLGAGRPDADVPSARGGSPGHTGPPVDELAAIRGEIDAIVRAEIGLLSAWIDGLPERAMPA